MQTAAKQLQRKLVYLERRNGKEEERFFIYSI